MKCYCFKGKDKICEPIKQNYKPKKMSKIELFLWHLKTGYCLKHPNTCAPLFAYENGLRDNPKKAKEWRIA